MMDHSEPVISAALTRARQEHAKQQSVKQDVLSTALVQTVVHTEVPTDAEVPVAKPKRTRKKVVD